MPRLVPQGGLDGLDIVMLFRSILLLIHLRQSDCRQTCDGQYQEIPSCR